MKHATTARSVRSAPPSPKHRHKFFCSHGGKILPRPTDGQLKYVGGETRCISAPRGIPFQDVMKRLTYLIDEDMILKYQLVTEDLDALVSVKSDEDVAHMFDEMEHYETAGCPRMRAFLFPTNQPPIVESPSIPVEQHYIYSINGIRLSPSPPASPDASTPPPQPNNHLQPQYYNNNGKNVAVPDQRLASMRSVDGLAANQPLYGSREINQGSCAKCVVRHGSRFYDKRIIERQTTLPAHF